MQYTTHYNLNLPEGTDIVNPLVQDNPNYSAIDAAMFANKQAVIGSATEIVSGTVHAITRLNTDSDYFRFTATGNWASGDTMSVDGVNVSVFLSDGTTPGTGAYIINTEVLALLSGSRVTLLVSSAGSLAASDVSYDNSGSGLIATDVQDAIDEIDAKSLKQASVIAGSGDTYADVLNALFNAIPDLNDIHMASLTLAAGGAEYILTCYQKYSTEILFMSPIALSASSYDIQSCTLRSANSKLFNASIAPTFVRNDISSATAAGVVATLNYI